MVTNYVSVMSGSLEASSLLGIVIFQKLRDKAVPCQTGRLIIWLLSFFITELGPRAIGTGGPSRKKIFAKYYNCN